MSFVCDRVIIACSYCKLQDFASVSHLEKHWKMDCKIKCALTCKCQKCSCYHCESILDQNNCIEYYNPYTVKTETLFTYYKNDSRHLFYTVDNFY